MRILLALWLICILLAPPVSATPPQTFLPLAGESNGDRFGYAVSEAGDVNGDGFGDVIVGAPNNDVAGTDAGRAYVYFGGPGASASPDLVFDGEFAGDGFGTAVSGAGDINNDGYDDLLVGAPMSSAVGIAAGRAYVYFGGPGADSVPDLVLDAEAAGDRFGESISEAGDLNGDGFADLVVGAVLSDSAGVDAGRAYVYFGGPGVDATPDLVLDGEAAGDEFGRARGISGPCDLNGDGWTDLAVSGRRNDTIARDEGRVYVYFGGPGLDAVPDFTLDGQTIDGLLGNSVSGAGDVNGDSYDDLLVGARNHIYVYYGGPSLDATPDLTFLDTIGEAWNATGPGDVNGDGYADVVISAVTNTGRVDLFYGSSQPDTTADQVWYGEAPGDWFGYSVTGAGDFKGDGIADIIVGAPQFSTFVPGKAYVLSPPPTRLYVDWLATGAGTGESWTDAFAYLQDALALAQVYPHITEIWVAFGEYYPSLGTDRTETFALRDGLSMYGGFFGDEISVSERDVETHRTVLSGDLGTLGVVTDNSFHVVTGSGVDSSAVIDGFVISNGSADGAGDDGNGGGMINIGGAPTVRNVVFKDNRAIRGAAMYNRNTDPAQIQNAVFINNNADITGAVGGGGIYNENADPLLVNASFAANEAASGRAVYNDGASPRIYNSVLWTGTPGVLIKDIYNTGASAPVIAHSIVRNSGGSGVWDPSMGVDGGNNLDADPLFANPDADLRLIAGSPGINAGDNIAPNLPAEDLAGNPRIDVGVVDMGAYEAQCSPYAYGTVLYVNEQNLFGIQDGLSWGTAFSELYDALRVALPCAEITEIWVAKGLYKPVQELYGTDRDASFVLRAGLQVYGGFGGTEADKLDRDVPSNETTLSGELISVSPNDNSRHVVRVRDADGIVLDAFTISNGYTESEDGAGMLSRNASATLSRLTFKENAALQGGGLYCAGSGVGPLTLTDITFQDNAALGDGGGMAVDAAAQLNRVSFLHNSAGGSGGGLHGSGASGVDVTNGVFAGNTAVSNGGGVWFDNCDGSLTNVSFSGNQAAAGSALRNDASDPTLVNVVAWGDSTTEISNQLSSPVISYSIVQGSGGSGSWNPSSGTDGGSNLDLDPLYVDPAGDDLRLLPGSPGIDAGNTSAPLLTNTDRAGAPRVYNGVVDMGAYEQVPCPSGPVLYVDHAATGSGDGSSWGDAMVDLQIALLTARACAQVSEVWVAEGTYTPTSGTDRMATFQMTSGLSVYGGFGGTEASLNQRDAGAHPTILSGEIGALGPSDNSFHVVTFADDLDAYTPVSSATTLDGFQIRYGNADGTLPHSQAGGAWVLGNPALRNLEVRENNAVSGGGAAFYGAASVIGVAFSNNVSTSSAGAVYCQGLPVFEDVSFNGNTAATDGGAVYVGSDHTTLINVTFTENAAVNGGALAVPFNESVSVVGGLFYRNDAQQSGGAVYNQGAGIYANVTMVENTALTSGGAFYCWFNSPHIQNAILWNNSAPTGPEVHNDVFASAQIAYSLVEGCGGSGAGWVTSFGTDGGGNIDVAPMFEDQGLGDLRLAAGSPAIDAGDTSEVSVPLTDLDGNERFVGSAIDLGPFENQGPATGVEVRLPTGRVLLSYPNPMVRSATVRYRISQSAHVRLRVLDHAGRLVKVLKDEIQSPDVYTILWDGTNSGGRRVASGVYFYRLDFGGSHESFKVIVLR